MFLALFLAALSCGVERADVKHLSDPKAHQVWTKPALTTVEQLVALPVPDPPVKGDEARGDPGAQEFGLFTVEAVVPFAKKETDLDAHIVLQDGTDTMIVESVDPRCAKGSVVLDGITTARNQLLKAVGASVLTTKALKRLQGKRVRVTGVGFFDKLHGQTGVAPNGIELHPILALEVLE